MSKSNFGIMVDHETLGVDPKAVVPQTAMVGFDLDTGGELEDGYGADLKYNLEVDAQQRIGRTVDMSTVEWWLLQEEEARKRFLPFAYGTVDQLRKRLENINEFIRFRADYARESGGRFEIWSQGSMDMNQLESMFRFFSIKPAWKYNEVWDLRTARATYGIEDVPNQKGHIKHDCLSDCYYQIKCYRAILRERGDIE